MASTYVACIACNAVNRMPQERLQQDPKCGQCKKALPVHGNLIEQSPAALQALVRVADRPVVVDYWASWCGPCMSFAPTYEKASEQLKDKYIFVKVNTEQYPEASQIYGIRGIPTLMVFQGGKEKTRISGALPLPQFTAWLAQAGAV